MPCCSVKFLLLCWEAYIENQGAGDVAEFSVRGTEGGHATGRGNGSAHLKNELGGGGGGASSSGNPVITLYSTVQLCRTRHNPQQPCTTSSPSLDCLAWCTTYFVLPKEWRGMVIKNRWGPKHRLAPYAQDNVKLVSSAIRSMADFA